MRQNTKQIKGEYLLAFMDYLKLVFNWHSGIGNAAKKPPAVVATAFVAGLQPEIQEQLQSIAVWWQTKPLTELVSNAYLCIACWEKDSETKLMALQIQYLAPGNTSRSS